MWQPEMFIFNELIPPPDDSGIELIFKKHY